jgi:hypothetical protein
MLENVLVQETVTNIDHNRMTVLHYVATWNFYDIAERLVESRQTDVCARDRNGRTAAHLACMFGSRAVLSLSLSTGCIDINAADSYGNTLLHCAVEGRNQSCMEELLWRDGIGLNRMNRSSKTAFDVTYSYLDQKDAGLVRGMLEHVGCQPGLWRPSQLYQQTFETSTDKAGGVECRYERQLSLVPFGYNFNGDQGE